MVIGFQARILQIYRAMGGAAADTAAHQCRRMVGRRQGRVIIRRKGGPPMPIRLIIARSTAQKADVYRFRHRVFVEEEQRFTSNGNHITDQYDSFGETVNVLAYDGDQPIGSIRVIMENDVGFPADDFYDFAPFRRTLQGTCACIGWLCCARKYRRHPGLVIGLIKMCFREMRKKGARHVLATLHPPVLPMLERIVGAHAIGPEFVSDTLQVAMVPVHVDLHHLPTGSRETFDDPSGMIFADSDERRIYRKGEIVVRKGEIGTEAFLMMRGAVRVVDDGGAGNHNAVSPMFGPGQIFGELSLLDGGPRTSTIAASSMEADIMVWKRRDLLEQLRHDQDRALRVLELLGTRLRHQIEGRLPDPPVSLTARILVNSSHRGELPVNRQWLSRQCGIGGNTFQDIMASWEQARWITTDPDNGCLAVNDRERLLAQIGTP
jgi:CRP-like cAMP-binding protein